MPNLPKQPKPHEPPAIRQAWADERAAARHARAVGDSTSEWGTSSSQPILNSNPSSAARASWLRRIVRGQYGHGSPSTVMSQAKRAISGFHGRCVSERGSGIAAMSGSCGPCPMSPAAKPANPAPSSSSASRCAIGTSLAFGLPCMSTNWAKRNSTPFSSSSARSSPAEGDVSVAMGQSYQLRSGATGNGRRGPFYCT